jgi:hypothetical protein
VRIDLHEDEGPEGDETPTGAYDPSKKRQEGMSAATNRGGFVEGTNP